MGRFRLAPYLTGSGARGRAGSKGDPRFPAAERGRTELVNKALKYAVVADKRHAWQLLRSLPLRQWNRTTFRRLKRFLLHHES